MYNSRVSILMFVCTTVCGCYLLLRLQQPLILYLHTPSRRFELVCTLYCELIVCVHVVLLYHSLLAVMHA